MRAARHRAAASGAISIKLKLVGLLTVIAMFSLPVAGSPAARATHRVPADMDGQWAIPWQGGTEYLRLAGSQFTFFYDSPSGGSARGQVSVSGDTITFYSSNECTGTGTYDWSLSDSGLTFVQAPGSSDPCLREPVLTSGTWTRPILAGPWSSGQKGYGHAKPRTIFNGGDPTGLVRQINWSSWGGRRAVGWGTGFWVRPRRIAAQGQFEKGAEIVLFHLGRCHARRAYDAIEWFWPRHRQHFRLHTYINPCNGTYHHSGR